MYNIGIKVHNRFDFDVRNAITGEPNPDYIGYYAENIVLHNFLHALTGYGSFFSGITFGTGSGTLDTERSTMFSYLGCRSASTVASSKAIPVSYIRRKIVLNPEEYVDRVLTEVGICPDYYYSPTTIYTHALIKDMNGNTVGLTKTSLDVVTIYATVYYTFSTTNENLEITNLGSNALLTYLVDLNAENINHYHDWHFFTGYSGLPSAPDGLGLISSICSNEQALTGTSHDYTLHRITSENHRFQVNSSNGDIQEVAVGYENPDYTIARLRLPAPGIYSGLPLADIPVAIGDGVTKSFCLPSRNVNSNTIVAKLDGLATACAPVKRHGLNHPYRSNPLGVYDMQPPSAWSSDGSCFIRGNYYKNVDVIYYNGKGFWVGRPTLAFASNDYTNSVGINRDGSVICFNRYSESLVRSYDWNGSAYVQRQTINAMPTNKRTRMALSGDGNVLAIATDSTAPGVRVFSWNGTSYSERPQITSLATCRMVELSDDGTVLAVHSSVAPYIHVFVWNGSIWVKRPDPVEPPTAYNAGYYHCSMSLSLNGNTVSVLGSGNSFQTYDWNGSAWIRRPDADVLPTGSSYSLSMNGDGTLLVVGCTGSPYILLYEYFDDGHGLRWTRVSTNDWVIRNVAEYTSYPRLLILAKNNSNTLCEIGNYFQTSYGTRDSCNIWDISKRYTWITFATPPAEGAVITADYTVDGVHKTNQRVLDVQLSITFGALN